MIVIDATVRVPEEEIRFAASRSSGPGGQHVNKASTRITLFFDVRNSPSLTAEQRRRILQRLATRISGEGILRVASQRHRSREANRRAALERFAELMRGALEEQPPRTATRPSRASREQRLREKKARAEIKRARGRVRE